MATATVLGSGAEFWATGGGGTYALIEDRSPVTKKIARLLKGEGLRRLQEQLNAAINNASGEATVKTYNQLTADTPVVAVGGAGGKRTIGTVDSMDSATVTAAEVTEMQELTTYPTGPSTYPVDKSDNGGTMDTTF